MSNEAKSKPHLHVVTESASTDDGELHWESLSEVLSGIPEILSEMDRPPEARSNLRVLTNSEMAANVRAMAESLRAEVESTVNDPTDQADALLAIDTAIDSLKLAERILKDTEVK